MSRRLALRVVAFVVVGAAAVGVGESIFDAPVVDANWTAAIEAELDRSIRAYPRAHAYGGPEALAAELLGDPFRFVLIVGNRLVVDRKLLTTKKGMHHVEFIRSVMERAPNKNFLYQFEWNANGANSEDQLVREGCPTPAKMPKTRVKAESWAMQHHRVPPPRIVIAKRYGYDQCGVMMPNCYFDDVVKWAKAAAKILAESRQHAFEDRDARVFWRGAIRRRTECEDEFGNFARAEAVGLTAAHPERFDVRCIACDVRDDAAHFCEDLQFSPGTRRAVETHGGAAHVNRSVYASYKYQLNLPGSVSGSYSRNLNHLWMLGSVVALWDAPYVEWYYPALSPKTTHLTVSRETAYAVLADADADAALIGRLRANARRVYDDLLCPDCLDAYWRRLVDGVRDYFDLGAVLDDPATLRRVLRGLDFENYELVEFGINGFAGGKSWTTGPSTHTSIRFISDVDRFLDELAPLPDGGQERKHPGKHQAPPSPKKAPKKKGGHHHGHRYSPKRKQAAFREKMKAAREGADEEDDVIWDAELASVMAG